MLDYRSDTFSTPPREMLEQILDAKIGDDVYGEDDTVNEIEDYAAKLLGKEAALFLPTSTMGNIAAIGTHCDARFSEMIVGDKQHIHIYEVGGSASLMGVHSRVLPNNSDGTIDLQQIKSAIQDNDIHFAKTKLICLENTHNLAGGRVLGLDYLDKVQSLAQKNQVKVHMDGARIFNAAAALKIDVKNIASKVDSVSICLSKGLAAPAGSLLVGDKSFIKSARHARKALGGGMRQAGVLAACGLYGLKMLRDRLQDDHTHARKLAEAIQDMKGVQLCSKVETNMFYVDVGDNKATHMINALEKEGVLVQDYGTGTIRVVTHINTPLSQVSQGIDAFSRAVKSVII